MHTQGLGVGAAGTMYLPSNVIVMASGRCNIIKSQKEQGQELVLAFSPRYLVSLSIK